MFQEFTKYDVVICGGGVAGISCAYICAKQGLKALLVEKENFLGGDVTGGLVVPVMKSNSSNLNCEFFNSLVEYAKKFDAQITYGDENCGWFNPVLLPMVFENMLCNVGVEILYEVQPCNADKIENEVCKIYLNSSVDFNKDRKMLSLPIESSYFVDATGNASLAKILKCKMWDDNLQKQPSSLRFIMSGVDLGKFSKFITELDSDRNITTTYLIDSNYHLSTAFTWDENKKWALEPYFRQAIKDGVLIDSDLAYFQVFTIAGMPNSVAFNCPRLVDFCDEKSYSKALIEARKAIYRLSNFVKKYLSGFKNSYISNIATKTGHRELARVKCEYDYVVDDIINEKEFENPCLKSNYPIDIHSNKKNSSVLYEVRSYSFPMESLRSVDYKNLYAIGKIAGCDFKSHGALRVQASCMSMGEGAARDIARRVKCK